MGQLRRRRPQVIANLQSWFLDIKTQQVLGAAGHSYLVGCWLTALNKFQNGTKASAAFNRRGNHGSWQFAKGDLRALHVEHMHRAGMPVSRAIETALGTTRIDYRELRRIRSRLPSTALPDDFFR
jgi:hypothetical protein